MQAHFSSFTPDAMRRFGQELAADFQRRREFVDNTKHQTSAFLADARADRQKRAERGADGRRLFMSELRSGVHALRSKFEIARHEVAADLREMASERRAASEAFRRRPGAQGGFFSRRGAQPATQAFSQEGAKLAGHSKKRHG